MASAIFVYNLSHSATEYNGHTRFLFGRHTFRLCTQTLLRALRASPEDPFRVWYAVRKCSTVQYPSYHVVSVKHRIFNSPTYTRHDCMFEVQNIDRSKKEGAIKTVCEISLQEQLPAY